MSGDTVADGKANLTYKGVYLEVLKKKKSRRAKSENKPLELALLCVRHTLGLPGLHYSCTRYMSGKCAVPAVLYAMANRN